MAQDGAPQRAHEEVNINAWLAVTVLGQKNRGGQGAEEGRRQGGGMEGEELKEEARKKGREEGEGKKEGGEEEKGCWREGRRRIEERSIEQMKGRKSRERGVEGGRQRNRKSPPGEEQPAGPNLSPTGGDRDS